MCRLMAYSGAPILAADLLFRPSRSIVRQSFDAKERANGAQTREVYAYGQLNADGFGLAFYGNVDGNPGEVDKVTLPCVFTECQPAWNSKNLRRLSEKIRAPLFFAHVRAAGPGLGVCDCKTHPFTYGRFAFMHNGEIAGFGLVRRKLLSGLKKDESFNLALAHGATDTAVAFALFVDQLPSPTESLSSFAIVQLLKNTIKTICEACEEADVRTACKLNFVVTDGQTIVATRYTFDLHKVTPGASLYYASGSSFAPTHNVEEETVMADPSLPAPKAVDYRIFHSERRSRMTIIASEPLTEVRSDWVSVPDNHVVVIRSSGEVLCAPFFLRFEPCLRARFAVSELTRAFSFLESQKAQLASSGVGSTVPYVTNRENKQLVRRESSSGPSTTFSSLESPRNRKVTYMQRCQSATPDKDTARRPMPLLKCRSTRVNSFGNDESFDGEPPTKMSAFASNGGNEIAFISNLVELKNPYHILAASGQVHVSSMLRYRNHLFSADGGAAGGRVCAYNLDTFELVAWASHWGILALCCDEDKGLLVGSRSDGHTILWDISDPELCGELPTIAKIILPRIGHVLCISMVESASALIVGSQDGFLRRIRLSSELSTTVRAIDCPACCENDGVEVMKSCGTTCVHCHERERQPISDIARSHCGFVTSVQILDGFIFSAGSCSLIKRWELSSNTCVETLGGHQGSVMDLCTLKRENVALLFSCALDGTIRAWDVSAKDASHFMLAFNTEFDDPLSCMCILPQQRRGYMDRICAGSTSGAVWIWEFTPASMPATTVLASNAQFPSLPKIMLNVSSSPINSLACVRDDASSIAVGAGSGRISVWMLPIAGRVDSYEPEMAEEDGCGEEGRDDELAYHRTDDDALMNCLAKFVSIRSVSSDPAFRQECLESANFILTLMEQLDCETRFCQARGRESIPCILGRMRSSRASPDGRYVFVYGHHDVVAANAEEWQTNPWSLQGVEGFIYGRGVSDDKGPVLAMLFAAAELRRQGRLGVDVVFCVEGEEEADLTIAQRRLNAVFTNYADFVWPPRKTSASNGDIPSEEERTPPLCIVISNNTWVNETRPCLTYGMRGVLDVELRVESQIPNLHSGVHGGALFEPLNDLVNVLHSCTELRDELAKHAAALSDAELARLMQVAAVMDQDRLFSVSHPSPSTRGRRDSNSDVSSLEEIIARWAQNSLSVSTIQTSNADNSFRKVPAHVSARVSVHFAPGLTVDACKQLVTTHFERVFAKQQTANAFSLKIVNVSDSWLGDVDSPAFVAMSKAIDKVWNAAPLFVREGGSYSGITSFLESELRSEAVHFPMAQANDRAHLNDERIRVENLTKGKRVFQELLLLLSPSAH